MQLSMHVIFIFFLFQCDPASFFSFPSNAFSFNVKFLSMPAIKVFLSFIILSKIIPLSALAVINMEPLGQKLYCSCQLFFQMACPLLWLTVFSSVTENFHDFLDLFVEFIFIAIFPYFTVRTLAFSLNTTICIMTSWPAFHVDFLSFFFNFIFVCQKFNNT